MLTSRNLRHQTLRPVANTSPVAASSVATASPPAARNKSKIQIPPKTRKLLKEHGLLELADEITCTGSKLMPTDVEAYLATGHGGESSEEFEARPLPQSQLTLNYRLRRGTQDCIPVTVMNEVDWTALQAARAAVKPTGGPTSFAMALWCVVQALKQHDAFRSSLSGDGRTRQVFHRVNLGIAVALPGDQMVTAVVRGADEMDRAAFFEAVHRQIEQARDGQDQADASTTLTVSNIGKAGMRIGIPAIVAPAMATLAIGETYPLPVPNGDSFRFQSSCTMTLSFDHRLANGVGAANFMNQIKSEIESFSVE